MGAIGRLFGGQTTTAREPVTRIPDEQGDAIADRRQREVRRAKQRRTFQNTNLSGGALGDTSESNTLVG